MSANTKQRTNEVCRPTRCAPRDSENPKPVEVSFNMKIKEIQKYYDDCAQQCVESSCDIHNHRVFLYRKLGRSLYQRLAAGPITDACVSIKKLKARSGPKFAVNKGINRIIFSMYCIIAARFAYRLVFALVFKEVVIKDDPDNQDENDVK